MKAMELRELTMDELKAREVELAEEYAHLKIQLSIKRLDNPLKVREVRKDLARVKTVIREKMLGLEKEGAEAEKTEETKEEAPKNSSSES